MSAIDITRNLHQPGKRFSSLLQYQGGVALDADANEGQQIQKGALGRVINDLLCAAGSPDDGFKIGDQAGSGYDFEIGAGTFYIGGMRLDADWPDTFDPAAGPERLRAQTDFLLYGQHAPATPTDPAPRYQNDWLPDNVSTCPTFAPESERTDLVWLEAFEQSVTGTEDAETIEAALGFDVSCRERPTRRLHVMENVSGDCHDAFAELVAALEAGGVATYRPKDASLRSNRTLEVGFDVSATSSDPCDPPTRNGYQWAENDTIQVRVIGENRFVWSINNAAPLYRADVLSSDTIELGAEPRDETLRPLAGDIVEVLRPGAMLPNGETIAEEHGHFYRVVTAYDPMTRQITLAGTPSLSDLADDDDGLAAELSADFDVDLVRNHLFVRLWRGSPAADGSDPGVPIVPGWILLESSGVRVRFDGVGPVGDYWTFSVRPETPDVIVPWGLNKPSPPTGPNRHIAGLAMVMWSESEGDSARTRPTVTDCRNRIRKLCEQTSCCEITVGDGHHSHGDVDTIAEAVALLPVSGGKICLLKGDHHGPLVIEGHDHVTISGCGQLTRILAPETAEGDDPYEGPLVHIVDCHHVKLHNFTVDAPANEAVVVSDGSKGSYGAGSSDIFIDNLWLRVRDFPAVVCDGAARFVLESSRIALLPYVGGRSSDQLTLGTRSAVNLLGMDMRVEGCRIGPAQDIEPIPTETGALPAIDLPAGGIKVHGGSLDVEIRRNVIFGGSQAGIRLGSVYGLEGVALEGNEDMAVVEEPTERVSSSIVLARDVRIADGNEMDGRFVRGPDGCYGFDPRPGSRPTDGGDDEPEWDPVAGPPIVGLVIDDNDILDMGESGISATAFFDISVGFETFGQYCAVVDVRISNNRISHCARHDGFALVDYLFVDYARGGIALGYAEHLSLTDNRIVDCGSNHDGPICAFYAATLVGALMVGNEMRGNGMRFTSPPDNMKLGQRGGIVVRYAQPSLDLAYSYDLGALAGNNGTGIADNMRLEIHSGSDALLIRANTVIVPEGRTLEIIGIGSMSIGGNQLTSLGANQTSLLFNRLWGGGGGSDGAEILIKSNMTNAMLGNPLVSILNLGVKLDGLADGNDADGGFFVGTHLEEDGEVSAGLAITNGRILFNSNQLHLSTIMAGYAQCFSVVALGSLDDVHVTDNQTDVDGELRPPQVFPAVVHLLAAAPTSRMIDNRTSEPLVEIDRDERLQLSGLNLAFVGMQKNNMGPFCFMQSAISGSSIRNHNIALKVADQECEWNEKTKTAYVMFFVVALIMLFASEN